MPAVELGRYVDVVVEVVGRYVEEPAVELGL